MSDADRELAEAWFSKAESNLRAVRIMLSDQQPPTDVVCFHCQQGAEKYLKGFLAWSAIPFPRTHDLVALPSIAVGVEPSMSVLHDQAELLNDYAVDVRYPDPEIEPSIEEAEAAERAALALRRLVRDLLGVM